MIFRTGCGYCAFLDQDSHITAYEIDKKVAVVFIQAPKHFLSVNSVKKEPYSGAWSREWHSNNPIQNWYKRTGRWSRGHICMSSSDNHGMLRKNEGESAEGKNKTQPVGIIRVTDADVMTCSFGPFCSGTWNHAHLRTLIGSFRHGHESKSGREESERAESWAATNYVGNRLKAWKFIWLCCGSDKSKEWLRSRRVKESCKPAPGQPDGARAETHDARKRLMHRVINNGIWITNSDKTKMSKLSDWAVGIEKLGFWGLHWTEHSNSSYNVDSRFLNVNELREKEVK